VLPKQNLYPKPPEDFNSKKLPIISYKNKAFRIYSLEKDPVYFGKTGENRFDAPNKEFGVMYLGCDAYCAFIETAQLILGAGYPAISLQWINQKGICIFEITRELQLVNLTEAPDKLISWGLNDAGIWAGAHNTSQLWSLLLWKHPQKIDGILYPARFDYSRNSIALYDRAKKKLRIEKKYELLNYDKLEEILESYQIGVISDIQFL